MEGALKLKELAYIHAEGFAAGELKHGPIALIDAGQPVFIVVPGPGTPHELHKKVVSNIQEIRARGARTIVVAEDGDEDVVPFADEVIRVPADLAAARAAADRRAAAGLRAAPVHRQGPRRRPAAQPRQVASRSSERALAGDRRGRDRRRRRGALRADPASAPPACASASSPTRSARCRSTPSPPGSPPRRRWPRRSGRRGACSWHDATVRRGEDGRPHLVVAGTVAARAEALGVHAMHVSLSHDAGIASAVVVAEG